MFAANFTFGSRPVLPVLGAVAGSAGGGVGDVLVQIRSQRRPRVVEVFLMDGKPDVAEGHEVPGLHRVGVRVEADRLELEVLENLVHIRWIGHCSAFLAW